MRMLIPARCRKAESAVSAYQLDVRDIKTQAQHGTRGQNLSTFTTWLHHMDVVAVNFMADGVLMQWPCGHSALGRNTQIQPATVTDSAMLAFAATSFLIQGPMHMIMLPLCQRLPRICPDERIVQRPISQSQHISCANIKRGHMQQMCSYQTCSYQLSRQGA